MDGPESYRCVCRLCRSYNLSLNWNEDLDEFITMSYKDCFYKYTQFKEIHAGPLSQFLCEDCATGVKNFHLLVEKSMETLKLCGLQFSIVSQSSSSAVAGDICSTESLLDNSSYIPRKGIPKIHSDVSIEYSVKSVGDYVISLEESNGEIENQIIASNENDPCGQVDVLSLSTELFPDDIKSNENSDQGLLQNRELTDATSKDLNLNSSDEKFTGTTIGDNVAKPECDSSDNLHKIECIDFVESDTVLCEETVDQKLETETDFLKSSIATRYSRKRHSNAEKTGVPNANRILLDFEDKPPSKIAKTPVMCSYCSKIVHNIYYLKLHEQTHEENRSREVSCPTCGVKLFNKHALYIHKKTHDKDRVKKFKCEFCDKAFFNRGACNVHRRIHLGQMTQCPLCPKQFYRQVELDRHMPSHSHETLNGGNRAKQKKYYVHCKECDKKVLSYAYNAHRAVHMNDPFMRCTLCEKDFFSRKTGAKHMSCVHKRKAGQYDDITIYYKNKDLPRLSFLIMRQQEDVEPVA